MSSPPEPTANRRSWIATAVFAIAPWSWFAVRDLGWLAEPFAVALPLIAAAAVVLSGLVAIVRRHPRPLIVTASSLAFLTVVVLAPRMPDPTRAPVDGIRIVSANVFSRNAVPGAAAETLAGTDADVLVVVEASQTLIDRLGAVDTVRSFAAPGPQIVVRSRWPVTVGVLPPSLPSARVLRVIVASPGGDVVVYAVHALNPAYESTFSRQLRFVDRLSRAAERETFPVVIAGDFNMSDRQLGYRRMSSRFIDTSRSSWAGDTYDHWIWRLLALRIDYVFVDRDWCAADAHRIDVPGSDHEAVAATVGPCGGGGATGGPSTALSPLTPSPSSP